jgi:hypothetical protein
MFILSKQFVFQIHEKTKSVNEHMFLVTLLYNFYNVPSKLQMTLTHIFFQTHVNILGFIFQRQYFIIINQHHKFNITHMINVTM